MTDTKSNIITCEYCNVPFNRPKLYEIHCLTKKHIRNQQGLKNAILHCELCNVYFASPKQQEVHNLTNKHKSKLYIKENKVELPSNFDCTLCNLKCRNKSEYDNHCTTGTHKSKEFINKLNININKCPYCFTEFQDFISMKKHVNFKHSDYSVSSTMIKGLDTIDNMPIRFYYFNLYRSLFYHNINTVMYSSKMIKLNKKTLSTNDNTTDIDTYSDKYFTSENALRDNIKLFKLICSHYNIPFTTVREHEIKVSLDDSDSDAMSCDDEVTANECDESSSSYDSEDEEDEEYEIDKGITHYKKMIDSLLENLKNKKGTEKECILNNIKVCEERIEKLKQSAKLI